MQRKRYKRTGKRTGKYKSGLEDTVAKMLQRRDAKYEVTKVPYVIPKNYIPDFTIKNDDGTLWHLEVKGWHRAEDQRKMRAVKFSNPELDIRFFFPKDGKVQGSDMLNSEWCEKYGFKYCIQRIPKHWFKGNSNRKSKTLETKQQRTRSGIQPRALQKKQREDSRTDILAQGQNTLRLDKRPVSKDVV